jgi:hypothetical protein
MTLLLVQFTIFYVFAMSAIRLYGGMVKFDSPEIVHNTAVPDNYYLMNFNDFPSAMVTLFVLMVVNNWFIIVGIFVDMSGSTMWTRLFFIVFYFLSVVVALNILIAFAIDMYSSVERLNQEVDDFKERSFIEKAEEAQQPLRFNTLKKTKERQEKFKLDTNSEILEDINGEDSKLSMRMNKENNPKIRIISEEIEEED